MLRTARAVDIPAICRVRMSVTENRLVSRVITEEDVREAIEETGRGWVIDLDGEVVAFAVGNARDGNLWALFVQPGFERRGFGRRLLAATLEWLWSRGLSRAWLTTEPGTRAQGFYEAAGWRLAGRTERGELCYEIERPA